MREGRATRHGRRGSRAARLGLAGCLMAAACTARPAPEDTPAAVVRAFFRALGRHDTDGVVELLHQDFTFRSADGGFAIGREDIPAVLGWDFAAGSDPDIESLAAAGDSVRVTLRERNRFTELLGLEPWRVEATFVVEDGRIREEVAREIVGGGPSFTERFRRALAPVVEWAGENRPEVARAVFEDGRVARYDAETARRLLRLLEAYEARTGRRPRDRPPPRLGRD